MEETKLLLEQSNRIERLLDKADEQGYLTSDQIQAAFPEVEAELGELENLFAQLYDQGIEVFDSEDVGAAGEKLDGSGESSDAPDLSDIPIDDTISLYFSEMSHVPLLTYEEEVELAKRLDRGREAQQALARNGHDPEERVRLESLIRQGEDARQHLIKANTRLVVSIAKRYRGNGLPFIDLIQAGNLGLIKAVDRFDYRRGNKFGTFATWWIRQSVTRSLTQQGRTIRIPVHMSDRIRRLLRTAQRLEQDLRCRPTPEEIAEEMRLRPSQVRWMMRVSQQPLSLDKPLGDGDGDSEFGSFIEDDRAPSPTQRAEQHLLRKDLQEMLQTLPPREAYVLRLRFGLRGDRALTLEEVGRKLGVTRERARQIERKALRKLRHPRHSRTLRSYL
jgi:RNA polymerase primary sigma factor